MATIGIDLTPIQGPHRMRGVGSTVINTLKYISNEDKSAHVYVFYLYDSGKQDALDLIDASSFMNYEIRIVPPTRTLPPSIKSLKGLLSIPSQLKNSFIDHKLGSKRITDLKNVDTFLQFEQDVVPPSGVPSTIIAYDLIPYVLEKDYLWNYNTARKLHNYSRRGALKKQAQRHLYLRNICTVMNRANKIIAISNHTKSDFIKLTKIPAAKIDVCHLGVSEKSITKQLKPTKINRYVNTSWGDIKIRTELPSTPFLLFIGGVDPRRKLADLIHAFNLLRAQGHQLHLVLAGDTLLGPNSTPNKEIKKALLASSYSNDIYMLGFIDDSTRDWLYQNALAFVYPSKYEGFGLPVLEAMQYGTPVITYPGSSISEVSKNTALFANGHLQIAAMAEKLLVNHEYVRTFRERSIKNARQFSWQKFAKFIIETHNTQSN